MNWDRGKFEEDRELRLTQQAEDTGLISLSKEFLAASYRRDYCYQWDWAGFPILQMPEDIVAYQEIVLTCKPTVIIECGVAWGGGIALAASLMSMYQPDGKVLGIDLNLDPSLQDRLRVLGLPVTIDLIRASSIDKDTVDWIKNKIGSEDSVMVVLDSHHTHQHVLAELKAYANFVSSGQFLIVGDTIIKDLADSTDRVRQWSLTDNPHTALEEFLLSNKDFNKDDRLSKKLLTTFHPGGYLRKS